MIRRTILVALLALLATACESALKEPSPIASFAPGNANGRSAAELVADANQAWARRNEPGQVAAAQGLYLDAAAEDSHRVDAVLGAMQAIAYRIEYEKGVPKGQLTEEGVQLGQWCQRRAPNNGECDYRLALALGQFAREHTSAGKDALNRIVDLLNRAITRAPSPRATAVQPPGAAPRSTHSSPAAGAAPIHAKASRSFG